MNTSQARRNMITTANAVELATRSVMLVLGHDCAKTRNGQKLVRKIVADSVAAKLGTRINDSCRG